jgi:hypothetical protein
MVNMEHEIIINLTSYVMAVVMIVGGLTFLSFSISKFIHRKEVK